MYGGKTSPCLVLSCCLDAVDWPQSLCPRGRQRVKASTAWDKLGAELLWLLRNFPVPLLSWGEIIFSLKGALAIYPPMAASQSGTARLYAFIIMRKTFVCYNSPTGDWRGGIEVGRGRGVQAPSLLCEGQLKHLFLGWKQNNK